MSQVRRGFWHDLTHTRVGKIILGLAALAIVGASGAYVADRYLSKRQNSNPPVSQNGNQGGIPGVSVSPTLVISPTPTIVPTPTLEQSLKERLFSLPDYTRNETEAMLTEIKTDGTITQEEADNVLGIANNPVFLKASQNDNLTYMLTLNDYPALFAELEAMPYSDYLVINLDKLGQAIDTKVRIEQKYGYESDLRQMNGTYIFGRYKDGKLLIPLDDESLNRLYPDKNKRDAMLMNLWFVQDWSYDPQLAKRLGLNAVPVIGREAEKANLEMLPKVYDAIMRAYNDPSFNVVSTYLGEKMSENAWARRGWSDWLNDRANNNWSNTVATFREIDKILSADSEFGKKWDMMKFIYGYAGKSHLQGFSINLFPSGDELAMVDMLPMRYKALGVPVTLATSSPSDGLLVTEFVIGGIPQYLLDKLTGYQIVDFKDYGLSLYSPRVAMESDGAMKLFYNSPLTRGTSGIIWER